MPPENAERRLPEGSASQTQMRTDPTPFTEASGSLAAAWTIEARLHLLAAGRLLELDPERRHQARHIFGLAARVPA